ncbi:hypothetical protein ACFFK0_00060 [Paenibacillus chartarius]|uniref:Uncharacterized protein n=1 Tax=Paenibacillus chartarius TaxID=747481 RepID=A0ABV6DDY2_9BACL
MTLVLHRTGESAPYFSGRLEDMLTVSEGRPWQLNRNGLEEVQVTAEAERIRIGCRLGSFHAALSLSFDERGLLRIDVTWSNRTGETQKDAAAGLLFDLPRRAGERITIPHMIYNNNPSSDPDRIVPRLGEGLGGAFICEEHRLPIPCVNVEWPYAADNPDDASPREGTRYFTLYSIPSYWEDGEGRVHYGSLGAIREESRMTVAAFSGVVVFNGSKDTVCIAKNRTQPYDGGYVDFPPGFSLTKSYALDFGLATAAGRGYREAVRTGLALFKPQGANPLALDEMIRLKTNALDDRWRTDERGAAGYVKFSDSNAFGNVSKHPLHFMYGWTGQCLKLAWCDAHLGFRLGEEERIERCTRAADFYVRESAAGVPGIRHGSYRLRDGEWSDFQWNRQPVVSSRAYGETMADLAEIVSLFRANGREVPGSWLNALNEAAVMMEEGLLPSGIYPPSWRMDGTPAESIVTAAGLPCVIALAKLYRLTGEERRLAHAEAAMRRYYELHAETFDRPFARSTLDAKCEDKEAGMYFFLAAYELYLITGNERYREWADLAADWLLTFVYLWNPAYDRGSAFRNAGFKAAFWPGVSVQNHHLDVFFPTFELWHYGRLTGNAEYERLGRMIRDALGQGICTKPGEWGFDVIGEQGEGFFQTHWNHRGHSNRWNPSWVVALVLHNALRFRDAAAAG